MLTALHAGSLVIVLMGPPGSGKGTHAAPLSRQLSIPHISTGDLFREHIRMKTPLGVAAKGFIDEGNLVPDELVSGMLFARLAGADCQNGCILDGFPRTLAQAHLLSAHLEGKNRIEVLNFNLADKTIIERIVGRLACKHCNRSYHKKFDPPKQESICDSCHQTLDERDDDKEEIICKRLQVYRAQTQPLIDYYAAQGGVLHEIDSKNPKEKVFQDVLDALPVQIFVK